jgi:hypothetical protein
VGPVVAPSAAFAESLIGTALGSLSGQAVVLDVPESQTRTLDLLKTRGFITQRTLLRMYRETNPIAGRPDQLFAIAGPELG